MLEGGEVRVVDEESLSSSKGEVAKPCDNCSFSSGVKASGSKLVLESSGSWEEIGVVWRARMRTEQRWR